MDYLYHGSSRKLRGEYLLPHKGDDSEERAENNLLAVYATDHRELAIIMALISCEDILGGSIDEYYEDGRVNATLYRGFPKQEYIYLHYLPIEGFSQTKIDKHQFVNPNKVKVVKTEKIKVKECKNLIKLASKEETIYWSRKYNIT